MLKIDPLGRECIRSFIEKTPAESTKMLDYLKIRAPANGRDGVPLADAGRPPSAAAGNGVPPEIILRISAHHLDE